MQGANQLIRRLVSKVVGAVSPQLALKMNPAIEGQIRQIATDVANYRTKDSRTFQRLECLYQHLPADVLIRKLEFGSRIERAAASVEFVRRSKA